MEEKVKRVVQYCEIMVDLHVLLCSFLFMGYQFSLFYVLLPILAPPLPQHILSTSLRDSLQCESYLNENHFNASTKFIFILWKNNLSCLVKRKAYFQRITCNKKNSKRKFNIKNCIKYWFFDFSIFRCSVPLHVCIGASHLPRNTSLHLSCRGISLLTQKSDPPFLSLSKSSHFSSIPYKHVLEYSTNASFE